jgi:hypothetical protein
LSMILTKLASKSNRFNCNLSGFRPSFLYWCVCVWEQRWKPVWENFLH